MSMMDMPIKEMEAYLGSSIKPNDFDNFWDREINSITEENLKYRMVKKEFKINNLNIMKFILMV